MAIEYPSVTQTHATFYKDITAASVEITDAALESVKAYFGQPSTEAGQEKLNSDLSGFLNFNYNKTHASRAVLGSIAASDAVSIGYVLQPTDTHPYESDYQTRHFPSRITSIHLHYGLTGESVHSTEYLLYAGPETPPLMVDKKAVEETNEIWTVQLSGLAKAMDALSGSKLYAPTASELQLVLAAIKKGRDDVSLTFIHNLASESRHLDPQDYEAWKADGNWFKQVSVALQEGGTTIGDLKAAAKQY